MKKIKIQYLLIAICIIIIAAIGIYQISSLQKEEKTDDTRWVIKEIYINGTIEDTTTVGPYTVPRWEEMSITQQFPEVKYGDSQYSSKHNKILNDNIGNNVCTAILTGYDVYTNNSYSKNAYLYTINNISDKCAIAVKFEDSSEYYVYTNAYYRPTTLGEFIEKLNLKEIISFGTIEYDYWNINSEGKKEYENVDFYDVDDTVIWNMLFSDTTVENVHNDNDSHIPLMSVSVDIPLLGYENIAVWVSEDGYLSTNILDTGKTFYIGKDKVEEFVNYIVENYTGHKIVYVYNDEEKIKEEIEENAIKEKIEVIENTLEKNILTNATEEETTQSRNVTEPYIPEIEN